MREVLQRESQRAERLLDGMITNLPWSHCMKVQRDISVNGEWRELRKGRS